jgi:hypothetical protein
MSSLLMLTYDLAPICTVTQDIEVDMPDPENLWEATSADHWQELMSQRTDTPITVRSAMRQLLFAIDDSGTQAESNKWSPYATCVVMHAVNIHMWNVMQVTQSFSVFGIDGYDETQFRPHQVTMVEIGLARCHNLLTNHSASEEISADDAEGPLLFNCLAMLRSAYVRVFTGTGSFDRIILLSSDERAITIAIRLFISNVQERNPFMTKAISKAFDAFHTPIKLGYLIVRKTAAFNWSLEHAVSAWDCCKLLSRLASLYHQANRWLQPCS